jgi:hypothetical protein
MKRKGGTTREIKGSTTREYNRAPINDMEPARPSAEFFLKQSLEQETNLPVKHPPKK